MNKTEDERKPDPKQGRPLGKGTGWPIILPGHVNIFLVNYTINGVPSGIAIHGKVDNI